MSSNPIAENVLGTMGTVCWAGQLIPQVWKNYKDKKTDGLSPWLMLIWGISSAFLGVYAILQNFNIPLQVQPQLFGFLALVSWGQCLYYDPRRQDKKKLSFSIVVGTMITVGALEVMLVFVSRPAYERGISAPVQLYGILSVVLIASGLLPQYWEIYKLREVRGISYTFICIDMLGGVLNDLSLAFSSEFNGLAAASYTAVTIMDSVIIFAALILNPRARKRRRLAAASSATDVESFADQIERETPNTTNQETHESISKEGAAESTGYKAPEIVVKCSNTDSDSEKKAVAEEKNRAHEECGEDTCFASYPAEPVSGTTTVVGDSDLLDEESNTG